MTHKISRRSFLQASGALAAMTTLSACSADNDDSAASNSNCRRFSLNDAASLANHLADLSTTEVAGTFYSSYLNTNKEPGGAIRWLPMCAEVDGTVANVDLFERYGIPLSTNYAEFVDAIDAFETAGIKGYGADWAYDYTCLETMQGCAIPEPMSLEGTAWRMNYESETPDSRSCLKESLANSKQFPAPTDYLTIIQGA